MNSYNLALVIAHYFIIYIEVTIVVILVISEGQSTQYPLLDLGYKWDFV